MWSSQSTALQHEPQVALRPSALGQHCWSLPHSGTTLHLPSSHEPTVHGSLSVSHCESLQHAAQPMPSQHSVAPSCLQKSCWQKLSTQESAVQGAPSSHTLGASPANPVQALRATQFSLVEQYSEAAQEASLGTNMHCPAKQVLVVQLTPSSQSASSQHCAHSPVQHFSEPGQRGDASHVPSGLQRSRVQTFLSSQSSGPLHDLLTLPPAPVPALAPLLVPEELDVPAALDVPALPVSSLPVNAVPLQPLLASPGGKAHISAKSTNLGLKKLTAISSAK